MLALGQQPYGVAAADLNGDGAPELLVGTGSGLSVFLNVPSGYPALPGQLSNVNGASFLAGPLALDSFATAQGSGLATGTQSASAPYPPILDGATVSVLDSSGVKQSAALAYVSSAQVNYIVPGTAVALGAATVTVTPGSGATSSQTVTIAAVGPGIFLFGGTNLVAANVLRVVGANQTVENVYSVNSSGGLVPAAHQSESGDRSGTTWCSTPQASADTVRPLTASR